MKKIGIYKIINKQNNKFYIGSSIDLDYRINRHKKDLKRQSHCNSYLQKSWNKYGEDSFHFEIVEFCEKEKIIEREQFYLDTLSPQYNICKIAGSTLGQNCEDFMTEEAIKEKRKKQSENISKALKGRSIDSDEAIERGAKYFNVYKANCKHFRTKGSPSVYEKGDHVGRFLKREDAAKAVGLPFNKKDKKRTLRFITRCLKKQRTQSHGYIFEYEEIS